MRTQIDNSVLEMALVGYSAKRDQIIQKIAEIERELGVRPMKAVASRAAAKAPAAEAEPKHKMSAAARRRISAAQKKRWAVFHAKSGAGKPTKNAKKKMAAKAAPRKAVSTDVRQKRIAALAKARAAKAAKRAAQVA